jgi:hypothetical protein
MLSLRDLLQHLGKEIESYRAERRRGLAGRRAPHQSVSVCLRHCLHARRLSGCPALEPGRCGAPISGYPRTAIRTAEAVLDPAVERVRPRGAANGPDASMPPVNFCSAATMARGSANRRAFAMAAAGALLAKPPAAAHANSGGVPLPGSHPPGCLRDGAPVPARAAGKGPADCHRWAADGGRIFRAAGGGPAARARLHAGHVAHRASQERPVARRVPGDLRGAARPRAVC